MISDKYLIDFFGLDQNGKYTKELGDIKSRLVRVQFENGENICTINEEADGMYFLEQGMAEVLNSDAEQINIMHEGEYFGEYAVLSKGRRLSTVRSVGRTVCYKISAKDLMKILSRHPDIYGELMKRVYSQVSRKHTQLLELSALRRGVLQTPSNRLPMSRRKLAITYLCVAIIFVLCILLIPVNASGPVFLVPLTFTLAYVLYTRRTLESMVLGCMLAASLLFRNGVSAGLTDAMSDTMLSKDNIYTVLVMTLMGGMTSLIEASGAVTAFKKHCDEKLNDSGSVMRSAIAIMIISAIDDCLNMICGATATRKVSEECRIPKEKTGLIFSILPTVLSSFIPLSLWGIFIIGTLSGSVEDNVISLFCKSIPFNFFSIITLAAMLLLSFGLLPRIPLLKKADERVKTGGELWPDGSEKYIHTDDDEAWGRPCNLLLPVICLAVASLAVRSIVNKGFAVDSACGLIATLIFMFFLYSFQGLMNPEKYVEHLIHGMSASVLPCVLYLLATCFSDLLRQLNISDFFANVVHSFDGMYWVLPAVIFLFSVLMTAALGSSWSMYAIAFPIVINIAQTAGLSLPLCIGALVAAGIAGESVCPFTGVDLDVANIIGSNPKTIGKIRLSYGLIFTGIAFASYLVAGLF